MTYDAACMILEHAYVLRLHSRESHSQPLYRRDRQPDTPRDGASSRLVREHSEVPHHSTRIRGAVQRYTLRARARKVFEGLAEKSEDRANLSLQSHMGRPDAGVVSIG